MRGLTFCDIFHTDKTSFDIPFSILIQRFIELASFTTPQLNDTFAFFKAESFSFLQKLNG